MHPALYVCGSYGNDLAQFACRNHLPSLANEWIAGVVVGQGEYAPCALCCRDHAIRIIQGNGHGFITDNMESGFHHAAGNIAVREVGCRHGDKVDAFVCRECIFLLEEFFP